MSKPVLKLPPRTDKLVANSPKNIIQTRTLNGMEVSVSRDLPKVEGALSLNYELISDKKVTLNHKKAEHHLLLPSLPSERRINNARVQALFNEMRLGNFNAPLVTIATAELNGKTVGMNGRHTCWSVLFMPPEFSVVVRALHYKVKTADHMRMLYRTFDRGWSRSDSHLANVMLDGSAVSADIGPGHIGRLIPGLKLWLYPDKRTSKQIGPEMVSALIQVHYPDVFLRTVRFLMPHWGTKIMQRRSVTGSLFATFNVVPTKAQDFWTGVASGLGLTSVNDPRYRLREFLLNTKIATRRSESPGQRGYRLVTAEDMYRVGIFCWNKWRDGEDMNTAPRIPKERPKPK